MSHWVSLLRLLFHRLKTITMRDIACEAGTLPLRVTISPRRPQAQYVPVVRITCLSSSRSTPWNRFGSNRPENQTELGSIMTRVRDE